jgi:hypothetical protein
MTASPDAQPPAETSAPALPRAEEAQHASPGVRLEVLLAALPAEGLTLAVLRDMVGQDGLLVLVIFLTLVFMIPVSVPGVSTVFGAGILLIGVSRLLGRNLWLPRRAAQRVLPAERLRSALRQGVRWLHRLERISRPQRLNWLADAGPAALVNNGALILGALLLMAPLAPIPFSNTLPALALLLLAIGLLQRDGVCVLLGHLANLASMVYFALLAVGGAVAIRETLRRFFGLAS